MYVSDDRTGQIGNCCRSLKTGGFLYDESFFSKISDVLGNNFFTAYSGWRMSVEISGVSAAADTTGNRGKGSAFSCALKLKVRDAIGTLMQRRLVGVDQLDECSRIVNENLAEIIDTAEKTVRQEGYTYPVTAQVATVEFPQKTYGNYTFPAGAYQALNVVIGSGRGQNWWCVMYPNMCFHDAVYEVVDEEAEKSLQRVLSEDEYDAVLKSGKYRIRFKYLDFLNRFMK